MDSNVKKKQAHLHEVIFPVHTANVRNDNCQPQITTGEFENREYNLHLFI